MRVLLLMLLAGCDAADPCEGKGAVCIAMHVTGNFTLDRLEVAATLPNGDRIGGTTKDSPFSLPVAFALLLPSTAIGPVAVDLAGSLAGEPVASGSGNLVVPESGQARLTIPLLSLASDLGMRDLPPSDLATDMGASVDAQPIDPNLQPNVYSFAPTMVGSSSSLTLMFSNPRKQDVVISSVQLIPPGPPFSLAGSCAVGKAVAPGSACNVIVQFGPTQRGGVSAELRVSYGADGQTSAFLDGTGVDWLAEGLEQDAGSVPTFYAIGGTSLGDVWTGGDHAALFHRTSSWSKATAPVSANTVIALSTDTQNDVWLAQSGKEIDHTLNGSLWAPMVLNVTGNFTALWGCCDELYAATSAGEIQHFVANSWNPERAADSTALHGVWGSSLSDVWAVGTGKILHRVNGSWQSTTAAGDHNAVWGDGSDVWIVGCNTANPNCGFIKHNGTAMTIPASGALYGVWGSATDDIFAVGASGMILHFDGTGWSVEPSGTNADLRAVWGDSGEVFAVGAGGTILHRY
jgi:hypothetical protein